MSQYFVKRGNTVQGPYPVATLRRGMESGKLLGSDLISENKDGPWSVLEKALSSNQTPPQPSQPEGDDNASNVSSKVDFVASKTKDSFGVLRDKAGVIKEKLTDADNINAIKEKTKQVAETVATQAKEIKNSKLVEDAVNRGKEEWEKSREFVSAEPIVPQRIDGTSSAKHDGGTSLSPSTIPQIDINNLPLVSPETLPPRAISNLEPGEQVHHFLRASTNADRKKSGCHFAVSYPFEKMRKTQNWAMVTSHKIVVESELQTITEENQQNVDTVAQFSFFTSYIDEVVSIKSESISNEHVIKTCGGARQKTNENLLVVTLTDGVISILVDNVQELLNVQKTIMILRQKKGHANGEAK